MRLLKKPAENSSRGRADRLREAPARRRWRVGLVEAIRANSHFYRFDYALDLKRFGIRVAVKLDQNHNPLTLLLRFAASEINGAPR